MWLTWAMAMSSSVFDVSARETRDRMLAAAKINEDFLRYATNGGNLHLKIDRYGDVTLTVSVNALNAPHTVSKTIIEGLSSEAFARERLALRP